VEFRIADQNAVYRGVSLEQLMDGAGREIAAFVHRRLPRGHPKVVVLAGKGNNGGDGFAAASRLARASSVVVVMAEGAEALDAEGPAGRALKTIESHHAIRRLDWARETKARIENEVRRADVVLDCLLGSGISGPARSPYRELIALTRRARGLVVSVDVPSGFPFAPAVRPDITLTIEERKIGMTRANSGSLVPIHIGFPPESWTHTGPGELLLIPRVPDFAQKADRGILAVVAGGPYSGAPALAAMAAYACGVGLVHVFTPESVADIVRKFDPMLVVHALDGKELSPEHASGLVDELAARRCAALAIGPGLGRAPRTLEAVRAIIGRTPLPAVVDADAIRAVATLKGRELAKAVVTPHAGEFKAFAGRSAPPDREVAARSAAAKAAARAHRTTVLLKGHWTVITDGERVKWNDAGVSAMAVGGTGDVLTGVVGAFLSKGLSPFDAARVGAFVCGKAGEIAFEDLGHSMKPTDLLARVPRVLARYLDWWGGRP
jgi:NAD(P)H-hydrate epimerase